jgi:Zn-dependent protease/CBS domain-containing protein
MLVVAGNQIKENYLMQTGWRIGSLFGIPFWIDSSWFWALILVPLLNANSFKATWGLPIALAAGFVMALLLFGSVLLHELGHSLVALSQGIKVNSITLFLFGGVASIERESKTTRGAFQVAIAGPAVSFGLFLLLTLGYKTLPLSGIFQVLISDLAAINLILAIFNLIPGLPLDGGQILKALVWQLTGSRFQGVHWAARSGIVVGWLGIIAGMAVVLMNLGFFNGLWLGAIGIFILNNAIAYDQMTNIQEAITQLVATDAMTNQFRVVDAKLTLRHFTDEYILANSLSADQNYQPVPFYAASDGRYRGMIVIEDLHHIERSRWETETLQNIARSLSEIVSLLEKAPLLEAINALEIHQLKYITVLSPAGAVAGIIDRGDIVRTVAAKLKLPFSEADIKRIKLEGTYPPTLPLQSIAKNMNN